MRDKKGTDNGVADHLSRMKIEEKIPIDDSLPEESIYAIEALPLTGAIMSPNYVTDTTTTAWSQAASPQHILVPSHRELPCGRGGDAAIPRIQQEEILERD